MEMVIKVLSVGTLQANCYILHNNEKAVIIDPGADVNKINKVTRGFNVVGIYYTHSHPDHIGALKDLEIKHNLKRNDFSNNIFNIDVINTPGHYFDSKTFYIKEKNIMFTGDFLFKGTIGRVDLYGADKKDMIDSLNLIKTYPENTVIYPGHGGSSTLKDELQTINYFIKVLNEE